MAMNLSLINRVPSLESLTGESPDQGVSGSFDAALSPS
jgi:hypothetical protein